jgi:hypothetical protein
MVTACLAERMELWYSAVPSIFCLYWSLLCAQGSVQRVAGPQTQESCIFPEHVEVQLPGRHPTSQFCGRWGTRRVDLRLSPLNIPCPLPHFCRQHSPIALSQICSMDLLPGGQRAWMLAVTVNCPVWVPQPPA